MNKYKWQIKYIKKCLESLAIKEMQIKRTLGFHLTPVKMTIIKKTKNTNVGEDVLKKKLLHTILGNVLSVQPLWKSVWSFLKKLKIDVQYDVAIPLLGR
jgi:hypothetical protein